MSESQYNLRSSPLGEGVRSLIPNEVVNTLWHLPRAILANLQFGFPSNKLIVIGVTGTKGKTSTAHLIYHILSKSKKKVALISTVSAMINGQEIDTGLHVTNPNPYKLQTLLKKMVDEDVEIVVLEVTSHGLAQHRNWGIRFELGIITNIQADHIQYHGGIDKYRLAKAKLISQSSKVFLNADDPQREFLTLFAKKHNVPVILYSGNIDDFQSQNQQAAIKVSQEFGVTENKAKSLLSTFPGIPGRMETIQDTPLMVVIDFAHTPDSLKAALLTLRRKVDKGSRLIAVFGCAGQRDPGRRMMGAVAAKYADLFIITAEDPRTERVEKISSDIAKHAVNEGAIEISQEKFHSYERKQNKSSAIFTRIPDRKKAIAKAIHIARPGDVVGLFGKGHEKSMCFGKTEYPWSEHEVVHQALNITKRKEEK